jgi:conjugal transfer pilus assembly protein TraB
MDTGGKFNKIKKAWEEMEPDRKKKVVVVSIIGGILLLSLIAYKMRTTGAPPVAQKQEKKKDISLEPRLLEKSQYNEMQKSFKEMEESLKKIDERMVGIEQKKPAIGETLPAAPPAALPAPPPPPATSYSIPPPPGSPSGGPRPESAQLETFGDIEVVSQKVEKEVKEDKKKESLKIYLPPSFMEATLLSGLDAPTSEGAQGHPSPTLIRVKDLAVLPNRVKANLKGCFLIAEGYGSLSDERAHLRLTNLSCLSKKGQSVIDQKVKGFVVDSDGKIGLRGKVVAKFGSKIAMGLLAGLFGGAGDALRTSATTTSFSALGSTQVIDSNELTRSSIGGALSQAAKELQKFYLDLGKQSMPVVEIGAMKNITVVISEGVNLEVRERDNACMGGKECEAK